ncbi:MAG: hypothetical protein AMJ54_14170 [Deltaproteobacteria bacterium SG8_13]|nr:MAG: hypothetical protein AMJ54_14170 [Deltaproteobacteria bacterium SG8_13]
MKYLSPQRRFKCRFDFEVGHLVKSPCRECDFRKTSFPVCSHDCIVLNKIQSILSESVSCTKRS